MGRGVVLCSLPHGGGGGGPLKARPRNGPHPGWSKELVKVLEQGRGFTAEEGESGGRGGH